MFNLTDIRSSIRMMLDEGYDQATAVAVILARADSSAQRAMAEAWLGREADILDRNRVRSVESTTFAQRREARAARRAELADIAVGAYPETLARLEVANEFIDLYDQAFTYEKGKPEVTFADAEEWQHVARIGMLDSQVIGLQETIGRHEEIIEILRRFDIKRLGDLRKVPVA